MEKPLVPREKHKLDPVVVPSMGEAVPPCYGSGALFKLCFQEPQDIPTFRRMLLLYIDSL